MSLAPRLAARGSTPGQRPRLGARPRGAARMDRFRESRVSGREANAILQSAFPAAYEWLQRPGVRSGRQPWSFPCSFPGCFCSLVGVFVGLCFCFHDNHFMTSLRRLSCYFFFSLLSGVFPFMLFVTFKPRNGFVTLDLGVPFFGAALPGN